MKLLSGKVSRVHWKEHQRGDDQRDPTALEHFHYVGGYECQIDDGKYPAITMAPGRPQRQISRTVRNNNTVVT
jgi:hypothetical protein